MFDSIQKRAFTLAFGVLVAAGLTGLLYGWGPHARWFPGCLLHRLTGLHCPGCGMTRAAYASLHGDFGAAFRFNPLGMILLPGALVAIALELLVWVRGKPLPVTLRVGGRWAWAMVVLILLFWVLRNIPLWPCTLLAPT